MNPNVLDIGLFAKSINTSLDLPTVKTSLLRPIELTDKSLVKRSHCLRIMMIKCMHFCIRAQKLTHLCGPFKWVS